MGFHPNPLQLMEALKGVDPFRITSDDPTLVPAKALPENYVCPFKANEDRVVVFVLPNDLKSKVGLVIVDTTQKPLSVGQVVAIGEQVHKSITVGIKVMFPTPAGYDFTYDEVDLRVIRATNIEIID